MSFESKLASLAQKITSEKAWNDLCDSFGDLENNGIQGYVNSTVNPGWAMEWYWQREAARAKFGVYIVTEPLAQLNRVHPHLCAHKSNDPDLMMVAVTSSVEDAKNDRKLKMRLGRLLSKYMPLLTDHYIQELCAMHAAELDDNLEILQGWDLVNVYKNGTLASCMSKTDPDALSIVDKDGKVHHPAEVYMMPNIGMAVTRDSNGTVNARALVLLKEKKYIRANYGNPMLKRKLERLGWTVGNFSGQELRAIKISGDRYLMPYIDANGSTNNGINGTPVIYKDRLYIAKPQHLERAKARGASYTSASSTSGYMRVPTIRNEDLIDQDVMTGEELSGAGQIIHAFVNGVKGKTTIFNFAVYANGRPSTLAKNHDSLVLYRALVEDTFHAPRNGGVMLRTPENLVKAGYAQMHPSFYSGWVPLTSDLVRHKNHEYYIVKKDTVVVIDGSGESANYHVSEVDVKSLTKVHSTKVGLNMYAPKELVVKTVTGRKMVPGFHDIMQTWDGKWALRNSVRYHEIQGVNDFIYYVGDELPQELKVGGSYWRTRVDEEIKDRVLPRLDANRQTWLEDGRAENLVDAMTFVHGVRSLSYIFWGWHVQIGERSVYTTDGSSPFVGYFNYGSFQLTDEYRAFVETLRTPGVCYLNENCCALPLEEIIAIYKSYIENLYTTYIYGRAEANAVEAPAYLSGSNVVPVEIPQDEPVEV